MKYLQKNLKIDMVIAIISIYKPYLDISLIVASSKVRASITLSMIRGIESWHMSTTDRANNPAKNEYLYLRSREKRVFFLFITQVWILLIMWLAAI